MTYSPGQDIMFMPGEIREGKPWRRGTFQRVVNEQDSIVLVQLSGDPFSVCVYTKQIRPLTEKEQKMPTATASKPKAKDLRREAKALGVEGWEDMGLDELIKAVEEARETDAKPSKKSSKKSKAKKAAPVVDEDDEDDEDEDEDDDEDDDDEDEEDEAPAKSKKSSKKSKASSKSSKKASAKAEKPAKGKKADKSKKASAKKAAAEENENGNPYAQGTNLYWMAEALIKGGKVSTLVKNLHKKVEIKPRSRDYDEDALNAELQRRLIIVSQHLRNDYGFEMEKDGRGWDATIRCFKDE